MLPILGRLLEKVCAQQLSVYVESKQLLPVEQFGFRAKSSCEHALIAGLETWMGELDKGKLLGALFVDMSKAFDTVPHQLVY